MRVPSTSSIPVRRAPQQDRATKRVEAFLGAAESLFVEQGYEGTTMTAVAERAGSSIGALYSYFPDKVALARALASQYADALAAYWTPEFEQLDGASAKKFAESFLDNFLEFTTKQPAYWQLQAAPIRFRRDPATRHAFRVVLQKALQRCAPQLDDARAYLCANTVLQITKGMVTLYVDSNAVDRSRVVAEFKTVLSLYLKSVFSEKCS
ncbi:transcriptional regulator, TetR family [Terriglobus roseus]|uniref:Transcriptional regulator, TetR family n=1 Tax=Terriglobus roseus TaxID=392734 RepID=A0A1G7EKB8_9BACT|nr:transcriptional regulator, TetR family [Terriglobus roseus]